MHPPASSLPTNPQEIRSQQLLHPRPSLPAPAPPRATRARTTKSLSYSPPNMLDGVMTRGPLLIHRSRPVPKRDPIINFTVTTCSGSPRHDTARHRESV